MDLENIKPQNNGMLIELQGMHFTSVISTCRLGEVDTHCNSVRACIGYPDKNEMNRALGHLCADIG